MIVPGGNGASLVDLEDAAKHQPAPHRVPARSPRRIRRRQPREAVGGAQGADGHRLPRDAGDRPGLFLGDLFPQRRAAFLFEIATNEPGFDRDEDIAHLGEALKLPQQHKHLRPVSRKPFAEAGRPSGQPLCAPSAGAGRSATSLDRISVRNHGRAQRRNRCSIRLCAHIEIRQARRPILFVLHGTGATRTSFRASGRSPAGGHRCVAAGRRIGNTGRRFFRRTGEGVTTCGPRAVRRRRWRVS